MSVSDQSINKSPVQLLRFLGISGPDAPNRLFDFVQGTVDLVPWWINSLVQGRATSVTPGVAALGFLVFPAAAATVPENQRWLVVAMSLNAPVSTAAHTLQVCGAWDDNTTGADVLAVGESGPLGANPSNNVVDCLRGELLILSAGDRLGCILEINTGATPAAVGLNFRYASFAV